MIYTLTLNPAVDKAVYIDGLKLGEVNRGAPGMYDPAGKGVNVSRALTRFGAPSVALTFCGGAVGPMFRALLEQEGVPHLLVPMKASVRITVNVADSKAGTFTVLTEPGGPVSEHEAAALEAALLERVQPGDWVMMSGSLPPGMPSDTYRRLAQRARELGAHIALDCAGAALRAGIEAGPDVIKPNLEELSEYAGRELELNQAVELCRELIAGGVGAALLSLGGDGAALITADCALRARGVDVKVLSTLGAGDTLLAAYVCAVTQGDGPERALRRAISASAAKVTLPGTDMPGADALDMYAGAVVVERL